MGAPCRNGLLEQALDARGKPLVRGFLDLAAVIDDADDLDHEVHEDGFALKSGATSKTYCLSQKASGCFDLGLNRVASHFLRTKMRRWLKSDEISQQELDLTSGTISL